MTSDTRWLLVFFVLLTVLIAPWRNSSIQDDGAYAYSAVSIAEGSGARHAGTIAMNFTQFALGVGVLKLLPSLPKLAVLNFTTWLLFLSTILILNLMLAAPWLLIVSFFSFPIWIQYGAIYHGETYSAFLLVLLLWWLARIDEREINLIHCVGAFVFSWLVGTQLQNMALWPFCWGLFMLAGSDKKRRRLGVALVVGALASIGTFLLMKKTPFQSAYSFWLTKSWLDMGFRFPVFFFLSYLQMGIATGLYLLPLAIISNRKRRSILGVAVLQAAFILVMLNSEIPALSGGVLFLDYFPRSLALSVLSCGIWGWWGIWPQMKNLLEDQSVISGKGTAIAFLGILAFNTYRFGIDLRYSMTWGIPLLFHLRKSLVKDRPEVGNKIIFAGTALVISVFLNLYLLNTTDARWAGASDLEKSGVAKTQISAGYGWNTFMIASPCMYKTIEKLEATNSSSDLPVWKRQIFFDRFLSRYGRNYEDEWVPRFILKPNKIFGYSFELRKNLVAGQKTEPVRYIDYSVLGVPCQLAVYENKNFEPAWCDK